MEGSQNWSWKHDQPSKRDEMERCFLITMTSLWWQHGWHENFTCESWPGIPLNSLTKKCMYKRREASMSNITDWQWMSIPCCRVVLGHASVLQGTVTAHYQRHSASFSHTKPTQKSQITFQPHLGWVKASKSHDLHHFCLSISSCFHSNGCSVSSRALFCWRGLNQTKRRENIKIPSKKQSHQGSRQTTCTSK